MKKLISKRHSETFLWLMLFVAMLACMTGLAFGEIDKAPDKPSVIKSDKGNISFSHAKHNKVEGGCGACHSMFPPKGGQIEALMSSGKLKEKAVMALCRDCHGKVLDAGMETGPTSDCMGCHKK